MAEQTDDGKIKTYLRGINLIARETDRVVYYYVLNEHGDVTHLWNQNGTCQALYEYDAFGVERNPDEEDENSFRYCGEYFDLSNETYYLRSRYYYPSNGRFLTEDPKRDGLNYYTYANNNPLFFIDPTGWVAVALSDWYNQKLDYITERYKNVSGVLDWNSDTKTASVLMMAGGYGGYGEFKSGVNGTYISPKDGKMYVEEKLLWQAFGTAIDPPLEIDTTRDTAVMASAIVLAAKGPAIVKGVEKVATTYIAPIVAGASVGTKTNGTIQAGVNFTNTTLKRMQDPNRFVPISTLMDAIKYGKMTADPQGTQAMMHTIEMFKNGKAYNLEVLYDQATNTILHFLYK